MSPIRRWWAKALLFTIGLTGLFSFLILLLMVQPEPWASWAFLFCWGSLLSFSAIPLALMGFVAKSPLPNFKNIRLELPWAMVGGLAGLIMPLSRWLQSDFQQSAIFDLTCFGPLLFLMGFCLGGIMRKAILSMIALFAAPFISSALIPWLGPSLASLVTILISIGAVGLIFYWRWQGRGVTDNGGFGADPAAAPKLDELLADLEQYEYTETWKPLPSWLEDDEDLLQRLSEWQKLLRNR